MNYSQYYIKCRENYPQQDKPSLEEFYYNPVVQIPVHTFDYFKRLGFSNGMFKNSEKYFKRCLSIPLHPKLEIADLENIKEILNEFFSDYN